MKTDHFKVNVEKDLDLFVRVWKPDVSTKKVIHILHGMSEHSERYHDFAKACVKEGYTVYVHDHRNHGYSLRKNKNLGMFDKKDTFEQIVQDVLLVQNEIYYREDTSKIITLGHSMGSIILRRFLQTNPPLVSKAIIMGTLPRYPSYYSGLMVSMAYISSLFVKEDKRHYFIANNLKKNTAKGVGSNVKNAWISNDERVVKKYNDDPLCGFVYNKYFYRYFFKCIHTVNKLKTIAMSKNVPYLFISGTQDSLLNSVDEIDRLNADYHRVIPNFNSTVMLIKDSRHEVLNDMDKESSYQKILEWL